MEAQDSGSSSQTTARAPTLSASAGPSWSTSSVDNDTEVSSRAGSTYRPRKSKFDNIFSKSYEKDTGTGQWKSFRLCLLCQEKKIKFEVCCPKYNTSNLTQHLRKCHQDVPGVSEQISSKRKMSGSQNIMTMMKQESSSLMSPVGPLSDQLLHYLKLLTCVGNISINTLTSQLFKEFAVCLNPRVEHFYPGRNLI